MSTILVTSTTGFIGSSLCKRLLVEVMKTIVELGNMNSCCDVDIKKDRLSMLKDADGCN